VQSDPIGLDGKLTGTYRYTASDPVSDIDPLGLKKPPQVKNYKSCKIVGKPQRTRGANGPRHAAQSLAVARNSARNSPGAEIHLDRPLNDSVGGGGNRRPDVLIKHPNGNIYLCEVCSPSQSPASQIQKMKDMRTAIGNPPGNDILK